jgi:hypothetical protein
MNAFEAMAMQCFITAGLYFFGINTPEDLVGQQMTAGCLFLVMSALYKRGYF